MADSRCPDGSGLESTGAQKRIGFIGGTGPEGRGLALRLALVGHRVLIGSRDGGRAAQAAAKVSAKVSQNAAGSGLNADVAERAEIVFVTLPYAGQRRTLESLREELSGKIVVSTVAPLQFSNGRAGAVAVADGSAAQEAQAILTESSVVAAFQTVSARDLLTPDKSVDSDVIVCADKGEAKGVVMELAEAIEGVRAIDGGGLENARYVEDFTALLLNINSIYKVHASLKIGGIS